MSTSSHLRVRRRIHNSIELVPRQRRIHNSIELVPRQRNHRRVHKGLGQVYRSPPKKRSQAHHAVTVICPLKAARRKALEEKFRRLNENLPRSATEENDTFQSPADVSNDNAMDLDEDYVDLNVKDPRPPQETTENKRDTHGEAQRLYNAWKKLVPTLVLPLLTYLNKSAGQPTSNTFEMSPMSCTSCAPHTHKTTRILCLFWDRKYCIQSPVLSLLNIWQIMKQLM